MTRFNVYCDESCHLEEDQHPVMVLGAVWCSTDDVRAATNELRAIRIRHSCPTARELKWTKVSPAGYQLYADYIRCFFELPALHFRGIVAQKGALSHQDFNQSHDDWYYKMFFDLLKPVIQPDSSYAIYFDYKDSRGQGKLDRLEEILATRLRTRRSEIIERMQLVRSHEVELLQLTDLLSGALSAANRSGGVASRAKLDLIDLVRQGAGRSLTYSSPADDTKFNVFQWQPGFPRKR